MKKILVLNTVYEGGGAASFSREIFNMYGESGYDSHFAFGRGKHVNNKNVFKFGFFLETLIHIFLVRFLGLEGWGSFFSTKKLIRYIKRNNFDYIHINNLHGYYTNYHQLISFLNTTQIKVIWTLHDEWALTWLQAHSMGCNHCKTLEGECVNSYSYPKNIFPIFSKFNLYKKQKTFTSFKNVIIISPASWLNEEIKKSYLKNKISKVISNGVDINFFTPGAYRKETREKFHLPADKVIYAFPARDLKDKNKGFVYIKKIASITSDDSILFLGIGSNDDSEIKNIKYIGNLSKEEYRDVLSSCNAFILPSIVETQSLFLLEAMSCGLPSFAFETASISEPFINEVIFVAPRGNTQELYNLITRFKNNSNLISAISNDSRKIIIDNFSIEDCHKKYKSILESI